MGETGLVPPVEEDPTNLAMFDIMYKMLPREDSHLTPRLDIPLPQGEKIVIENQRPYPR